MKVLKNVNDAISYFAQPSSKTRGFVPTMGALHKGHLSLVGLSKQICEETVVSVFVNPEQFNNPEDLANYPRTEKDDQKLLEEAGCDILLMPMASEIYQQSMATLDFELGYIGDILEGKNRPGHFDGVCRVLTKLFSLVRPTDVFFGQKDIQQCYVVKKLVHSLLLPCEVHIGKTLREESGLAMSSRNRRLTEEGLKTARGIYHALQTGKEVIESGGSVRETLETIQETANMFEGLVLEQVDVILLPEFMLALPDQEVSGAFSIVLSGFVEEVRLIDNLTGFSEAK